MAAQAEGAAPPGRPLRLVGTCVDMGEGEGAGAASEAVERRGRGGGPVVRSEGNAEGGAAGAPLRRGGRTALGVPSELVEHGRSPFLGVGVEGVEVGPVRGRRVGVVECLLNVPQVEQLSAVRRPGLVHDARPGAA